jgi:hypothetical protein
MTDLSYDLQGYLGGSWTSVKPDLHAAEGVTAEHGYTGNLPDDRMASTGTLQFTLKNDIGNSGHVVGYYSPGHASCRAGFDLGALFRLKLSFGGVDKYQLRSKVQTAPPSPGIYGPRTTPVTCVDYFDDLAANTMQRVPVQTGKRIDQAIATVLAGMTIAPQHTSLATGIETYSRLLFGVRDEYDATINVLQKLHQTDKSYGFLTGDGTDGETYNYQTRQTRSMATVAAVFNGTMVELTPRRALDYILNDITTVSHPVTVDGSLQHLATANNEITIRPGVNPAFILSYTDPSGAGRRTSMVDGSQEDPPVAGVNFNFSSVSGSGSDLNSKITFTITWGGNSASVVATSTHTSTGYLLAGFYLRGKGIYDYNPVEANSVDAASKAAYNRHPYRYDLIWQDSKNMAQDFADAIKAERKNPMYFIEAVSYIANKSDTFMGYAVNCDVGSCIQNIEPVTGISGLYFIGSVKWEIQPGGILKVTYGNLEPASGTSPFRLSGPSNTYSLLNGADPLTF